MNIRTIRSLRYIRRFNFHHCNSYESVADHSFFVALIAHELSRDLMLEGSLISLIVKVALFHDIEESATGDIPYLVRRKISNMSDIEHEARIEIGCDFFNKFMDSLDDNDLINKIVDFADAFELKMYLEEERRSGNMGFSRIESEVWGRLHSIDIGNEEVKKEWMLKLETVVPKIIPEYFTHEGKDG